MILKTETFQHIYDPSVGQAESWCINDHCLIRDAAGLWHMFGITRTEPATNFSDVDGLS